MILFVVLFFFFIYYCKKGRYSITTYLLGYYIASLLGAFILSPSRFFAFNISFVNILYLIFSLLCIILCWRKFKIGEPIKISMSIHENHVFKWLMMVGTVLLMVNIVTVNYLNGVVTSYSEFKNGSDASFYFSSVPLPGFLLTFSAFISPVMLLALPYHFLYLVKGDLKKAIISFLISFNFVLIGLASFSRSNLVVYLIIYVFVYLLFKNQINPSIRKLFYITTSFFGTIIIGAIVIITINRFIGEAGENLYSAEYFVRDDSLIKDPVAASQLSYFSEWYLYAITNFETYDGEMLLNWSHPIFNILAEKLGFDQFSDANLQRRLMNIFKERYSFFQGISANILYDMGYFIGTFFFVIFNNYVIRLRKSTMSITRIMAVITLLIVPLMGIFNSALNGINIHLMIMTIMLIKLSRPNYKKV